MAVLYRCDICGREVTAFRSLKMDRIGIQFGQSQILATKTIDICSDACEIQAAIELLKVLTKATTVQAQQSARSDNSDSSPNIHNSTYSPNNPYGPPKTTRVD
jgi:hypothetical protein